MRLPRLVLPALSVLALAAVPATTTAAPRAHASIVNGTVAPAAGPLALVATDDALCSGSVISANVVLTAAHCVHDPGTGALLDPGTFVVQTGAVRIGDQAGAFTRVGRLVSHAWLTSNNSGDLALLQLATPTAAPALPLATDTTLLTAGTSALAEGWGVAVAGGDVPSADLRGGAEVVQSPGYCGAQALSIGVSLDTSSTLCAIDPSAVNSVCSGDSGGPLVARRADGTLAQIGITSFGTTGCSPTRPQFFTRVDAFSAWIASWVTALAPSAAPAAPAAPAVVTPPAPAPTTTTTTPAPAPTFVPSAGRATRYSRYLAHGGYLAATVPADGQHVTWLRVGLQLACQGGRHTYVNDVFPAPAKAGWPMSSTSPLRLTLTKPATRRFLRRSDTVRLTPGHGGLDGSVTVSMRARARSLGTCAGSVRSFRLTASR